MSRLQGLIKKAKQGQAVGIYSVCSAHPLVLKAAMRRAKQDGSLLLIEATANQVNQFGGYTGQTPADFIARVRQQALSEGLSPDQLMFGGDHLGPVVWRKETAEAALQKAEVLIAAFVEAGFEKIHLDTSMPCADDPQVLSDEVIAQRAARLCAMAERCCRPGQSLCYVIGTEVPAPGGVAELEQHLAPTPVANVQHTLQAHQQAFAQAGLTAAVWQKVIALVVQPGVEFDNSAVHLYQPELAGELSRFIQAQPNLVFEAHSTDYQTTALLTELVKGQFAILKVGPELTLALKEALFSLSLIEDELQPAVSSQLRALCRTLMLEKPGYWQSFYAAPDWQLLYSYSDRIRYYWPEAELQRAVSLLFSNLSAALPLPLVRQFMPLVYPLLKQGQIAANAEALVLAHLDVVLQSYANACQSASWSI